MQRMGTRHQSDQSFNQITDITKRPCLLSPPIDRNWIALKRLHNKVGNNTTVLSMHIRSISIEDTGHFYRQTMLSLIIKKQSLVAPLAFVITRANTNRINPTPVCFGLRVLFRIAINFTGRRLENFCACSLCKTQHINCTVNTGLGSLHRIELIMHR